MATENVWQRADDLTVRLFRVTCGLDLPCRDQWPKVVAVFLTQANERLASVILLLRKNHRSSAVIVTRSLFELAVNLAYIAKNIERRLPCYLRHGGNLLTKEEAELLQRRMRDNPHSVALEIVPGHAWTPLKRMCTGLGPGWVTEYRTFYRYASIPTHAGAFTLETSYEQLVKQQPMPASDKATLLITAIAFHLRIAEIAAKTFPKEVNPETVKSLTNEWRDLHSELSKQ